MNLCVMHKKKQDSGYYHCECSITIWPTSSENQKDLQMDDLIENVIIRVILQITILEKHPLNQQFRLMTDYFKILVVIHP